jgi:hypothetical protein
MADLRLPVEPTPAGSRLATLARLLPPQQWDRLRRRIYRKAGYRCRVCGRRGRLHCHELWQYNQQTSYQWLRGFQALCEDCHNVKHILFVRDDQERARLLEHFMAVNRLSRPEAAQCMVAARRRQHRLDQRNWIVNFGNYNWRMPSLTGVRQRQAYVACHHSRHRRG